jgi:tRNA(adenine34) deaminase
MKTAMSDEEAMRQAIALAEAAARLGETPVGCVILDAAGRIIGRGHNRRQIDADPTAHAEMLALRQAAGELGDWRLSGCTAVATLEPCPMCAGALVNARIARLVYGAADPKAGAARTLYQLCDDGRLNHRMAVRGGVLAEECGRLLQQFFQAQRAMGKK